MPQKLSDINLDSLIKQVENQIKTRANKVHKKAVEIASKEISSRMAKTEGLLYQYVRAFIDAMSISSVNDLGKDRDTNGVTVKPVGYESLSVGNYIWKGLAQSTIRRKKKKRKPQAWVDTRQLKEWLGRQYTIRESGSLNRVNGVLIEKTKYNWKDDTVSTIVRYQSSLRYFRATSQYFKYNLPADLEKKVRYNEKERPLFAPIRNAFMVDLLPRKLQTILRDENLVYDISEKLK